MKTKTTDGTTVVTMTADERKTLNKAVDVLIELAYKLDVAEAEPKAGEGAIAAIDMIRFVLLAANEATPKSEPTPPGKPPTISVPPENEVVKEGSVTPKSAKSAKSAKSGK